jgi:proline iminopeptidase
MRTACRAILGPATALAISCVLAAGNSPARAETAAHAAKLSDLGCPIREGYVNVTGGRVWYQVVGAGNATPLLVLHGGPGFPHDYLEPLAALCHERPVVFYDQLGCGKADRPKDKSLWRVDRFVDELAKVRATLGLRRVHILGHSWGTMLLTDYMLTKPDGVQSVVFSDPAISMPQFAKDAARYRKALPPEVLTTLTRHEQMGSTACPEYQGAVLEYYRRHVCRLNPYPDALELTMAGVGEDVYNTMNGPNEFYVVGNLKDYDRTARLHEIQQPALFICGRFDETSPEATEIYHKQMPGSEMIVFEKSAHLPVLEETDGYVAAVREFVAKHEAR